MQKNEKDSAAPTVDHAIKILRMPFTAAHDAGYIDINPNTRRPLCANSKTRHAMFQRTCSHREHLAALIKTAPSEDWKRRDPVRVLHRITTARHCRFGMARRRSTGGSDQANHRQDTERCRPPDPSTTRYMVQRTNSRHRQSAGVPALAGKAGGGKSGLSMAFRRIMDARR